MTTTRRLARRLLFLLVLLVALTGVAELVARLVWSADDVVLGAQNVILRDHPTLFWTLAPDMDRTLDGVNFRTNALGLRSPPVELPKPAGRVRILMIGESTTMGATVQAEDAYPAVVEGLLRAEGLDVDVVNAGTGAWTIWQSRVFLEETGLALEPDLVVAYHAINDLLPSGVIDTNNFLYAVPYTDRELWQRRKAIALPLGLLLHSRAYLALRKSVLLGDASLPTATPGMRFNDRVPEADRRDAWLDIVRLTKAAGAELVVMLPTYGIPCPDSFLRPFVARYDLDSVDIDAARARSGLDAKAFFADDVHPTPAGHRVIADALRPRLSQLVREAGSR